MRPQIGNLPVTQINALLSSFLPRIGRSDTFLLKRTLVFQAVQLLLQFLNHIALSIAASAISQILHTPLKVSDFRSLILFKL